jgi:type IV pilus assembly protein PilB
MPVFDDKKSNVRLEELHNREEEALVRSMAPKYGYQYIDLHGVTIDTEALMLVPEEAARQAELAPFAQANKKLSVAVRNPNNPHVKEVLEDLQKRRFVPEPYMATLSSIEYAWKRYQDVREATAEKRGVLDVDPDAIVKFSKEIKTHLDVTEHLHVLQKENSAERISQTIELIFGGALALKASDIHIEPEEKDIRLRYRLDGVLWDVASLEKVIYRHLLSRFKLLSGLVLNIHDEAQDGRFTFEFGERKLEVRSSVIPGSYGETIVMRVLDPTASSFKVENLGINEKLLTIIKRELSRPNGAFITTGPTGSGKTTALYAFMQVVHNPEIKIITIEDPVEYKLQGIVQTQVGEDYSFALGLRAILRQDPDVIMVGEIRDREVAETAVHAALTGHIVFSTLHTNSAVGAFPRLIDLGIDARMIGSAFNIVLGQRLVRKLCDQCKAERDTTAEEQKLIARIMDRPVAVSTVYEPKGCDECGGSGYRSRVGIFEAIVVDTAVEEAIIRDPRESTILQAATPQEIPNMQQDGVMKVLQGITSLDELSRVVDLYNAKNAISTEKTTPEES